MTAHSSRVRACPTALASIRREHVEAFMAAELEPTAVIRHALPVFTITGEVVLCAEMVPSAGYSAAALASSENTSAGATR
jgi:hypothetical protein